MLTEGGRPRHGRRTLALAMWPGPATAPRPTCRRSSQLPTNPNSCRSGRRANRRISAGFTVEANLGRLLPSAHARQRDPHLTDCPSISASRSGRSAGTVVGSICWRNNSDRHSRGRRVRDPSSAAANIVAAHHRKRSGEPVQAGLPKRGQRWDGGQRCRAIHVPPKAGAATDPASVPVEGRWHRFPRGSST